MLRKDTIYMLSQDTDSKVPTTEVIKAQAKRFEGRLAGSVRLATGRVLGSDWREIIEGKSKNEAPQKYRWRRRKRNNER